MLDDIAGATGVWYAPYILVLLLLVVVNLVAFNLLIAKMSNTYLEVQSKAKKQWMKDNYAMTEEHRHTEMALPSPFNVLFTLCKFITFLYSERPHFDDVRDEFKLFLKRNKKIPRRSNKGASKTKRGTSQNDDQDDTAKKHFSDLHDARKRFMSGLGDDPKNVTREMLFTSLYKMRSALSLEMEQLDCQMAQQAVENQPFSFPRHNAPLTLQSFGFEDVDVKQKVDVLQKVCNDVQFSPMTFFFLAFSSQSTLGLREEKELHQQKAESVTAGQRLEKILKRILGESQKCPVGRTEDLMLPSLAPIASFCFCYPSLLEDEDKQNKLLVALENGGFIYFDEEGKIVAFTTICSTSDELADYVTLEAVEQKPTKGREIHNDSEALAAKLQEQQLQFTSKEWDSFKVDKISHDSFIESNGSYFRVVDTYLLEFSSPQALTKQARSMLADRFQPVTVKRFLQQGCRRFAWMDPKQKLPGQSQSSTDEQLPYGGFAYTFDEAELDCYFPVKTIRKVL